MLGSSCGARHAGPTGCLMWPATTKQRIISPLVGVATRAPVVQTKVSHICGWGGGGDEEMGGFFRRDCKERCLSVQRDS